MKLSAPGELHFTVCPEEEPGKKILSGTGGLPIRISPLGPPPVDDYAKRLSEAMGETGFTAASPVQDAPDWNE